MKASAMTPKKLLKQSVYIVLWLVLMPIPVHADSIVTYIPKVNSEPQKQSLYFLSGIGSYTTQYASLQGIDFGVGYKIAFSAKWAMTTSVKQSLNISGFKNLNSEISLGASYALNRHYSERQKITLNGIEMADVRPYYEKGIFIIGNIVQYFFNGSQNVVPLTGIGFGGLYHFESSGKTQTHVGLSYNFAQNEANTISTIKVLFGFSYFL